MENEDRFVGLFAQTLLGIGFLSPVIKTFSSSWFREGTFLMKNVCPAFRELGKVGEHFLHLVFLRCLQLKMISVKVAYLGVAFSPQSYPTQEARGLGFLYT